MTERAVLEVGLFFLAVLLVAAPLGGFMTEVFSGRRTFLHPALGWLERGALRLLGVSPEEDQAWWRYALSLLAFSLVSLLFTYALLRLQGVLPLNPQRFSGRQMPPDLAFNTATSFTTNTDWQAYTPESTVSYFSNMVALAMHNWASAAAGIAAAAALVRGFARHSAAGVGNFWVDVVRGTVYVLLPLAFLGALLYVWQGVPQNFAPYASAVGLEGGKQAIALGPVASQEAIKQLGTNGGGFFNANAAHPFENPTPLADAFGMFLIFAIPAGLTSMFGKMVGDARQGWTLFAAMSALFLAGAFGCIAAEHAGNPGFARLGVSAQNMEGKEQRFGVIDSALFATVTTDASCGAVNAMHDSFTPLGGLVPLFNVMTGEVIFGGVGSGLYGMLVFAILGVFIAGLMVGRTPEYVGKKIQAFEVKMAMLSILVLAASILGFTALACTAKLPSTGPAAAWNTVPGSAYGATDVAEGPPTGNLNNGGPHGFSEMLYAYTSATGNNGSAFAGLSANTPYYNLTLGLAMLVGRFLMLVPILAIAGNLAGKRLIPPTSGTLPTNNATFVLVLVGTVVLIGALTFLPALALGPIVEQLQMGAR